MLLKARYCCWYWRLDCLGWFEVNSTELEAPWRARTGPKINFLVALKGEFLIIKYGTMGLKSWWHLWLKCRRLDSQKWERKIMTKSKENKRERERERKIHHLQFHHNHHNFLSYFLCSHAKDEVHLDISPLMTSWRRYRYRVVKMTILQKKHISWDRSSIPIVINSLGSTYSYGVKPS